MRIETIGLAKLYLGDCREVIGGLAGVDHVITDPPYGIDPSGGGYGREGVAIANDKDLSVCIPVLNACTALLADGYMVAFHSPRNASQFITAALEFAELEHSLVWDKKAPGMGGAVRYQHECIAVFTVGAPKVCAPCFSVLSYYRDASLHPHMKPHGLMSKLVGTFTAPDEMILDPFMGSGSTGCAAVAMGRDFVGCELDERYFDIACKRIEDAQRQGDMFIEGAAA